MGSNKHVGNESHNAHKNIKIMEYRKIVLDIRQNISYIALLSPFNASHRECCNFDCTYLLFASHCKVQGIDLLNSTFQFSRLLF